MAISDKIYQIRHAVYGRDVRENIAGGIEECYSDVQTGVTRADTAATTANTAAATANTAANNANTKAEAAETAANNANTAAQAIAGQVADLKSAFNYCNVYFSNGSKPTITMSGSNTSAVINVHFPNSEFRIYGKDGTRYISTNAYATNDFVIGNLQKLVCSASGVITVKATTESSDYVLLTNAGGAMNGPFADYFYKNAVDSKSLYKNEIDMVPYFSNGQLPAFTVTGRGLNAIITITMPNADFRIYGRNGTLFFNKTSASYVTKEYSVSNLNKLVADTSNNTVEVVSTNSGNLEKIVLLANSDGVITGLLSDYYYSNRIQMLSYEEEYGVLNTVKDANASFLFFSDIHGDWRALHNILVKSKAYSNYITAIINGGDTAASQISVGELNWYNDYYGSDMKDMLICPGNHDVWSNQTTWELANKEVVYNELIAPMIEHVSDIVQPTGVSSSHALYYYKDYGSIRIIVLDAMVLGTTSIGWWDNSELSWLQATLNDALTNGLNVICVAHPPFEKTIAIRDNNSQLNSYYDWRTGAPSGRTWDNISIPSDALDAVQTFISNGGSFICWLSGHTHVDNVLTATGYEGQFMINIATANANNRIDSTKVYPDSNATSWYDLFDVVSIDLTSKTIKVYRIGNNTDQFMRVRKGFCYNWQTKSFI